MNDNNDIEKEISRVISGKIYEPKEYKIAIEKALYANDKKMKNTYVYKMIAAICCSLILLSGIVYAGYSIIQNVFNNRKGVDTAISNNYIMDGLESYQESNGIAVKINNMLIDDYNLDISFNVKFDNGQEVENIKLLQFEKIIILDEENRILFHTRGKEVLNDFIESNKLDINVKEFSDNNINTSAGFKVRNQQNNQLDLIYNLSTNDIEYPRSKEIIIYAENMILNDIDKINGKWQIKQKIEEKIYNRKSIYYSYEYKENNDIENIEVTTYETGTNISITMLFNEKISNEKNLQKILDEIEKQATNENLNESKSYTNELITKLINESDDTYKIFKDIYIENSNGTKFYVTNSLNENGEEYIVKDENKIIYYNIVDMTLYDYTDEIKIHFIYNEKEYNIKLKR